MKKKKLSHLAVAFILTRDIPELSTLTPEILASGLGVHPSLLAQVFQEEQRISVAGFILREKMHRAALILETTAKPLIESLASSLGFESTNAFSLEFEGYLAVDPAKYWELKHSKTTD